MSVLKIATTYNEFVSLDEMMMFEIEHLLGNIILYPWDKDYKIELEVFKDLFEGL